MHAELKDEMLDLTKRLDNVEFKGYVCNGSLSMGKVHLPKKEGIGFPAKDWKCKCGFKHGLADVVRVQTLPEDWKRICGSCLPSEKAEIKNRLGDDNDAASSSSSSSSTSILSLLRRSL